MINYKKIIGIVLMTVMLLTTVSYAMALEVDGNDSFVMQRGETLQSYFVLTGSGSGDITVDEAGFIRFENGKITTSTDDLEVLNSEAFVVPYKIVIPNDLDVGIYTQPILIITNNETTSFNVKMSVQNSFFYGLYTTFSSGASIGGLFIKGVYLGFITFLLLSLIVILILRKKMVGEKRGKRK